MQGSLELPCICLEQQIVDKDGRDHYGNEWCKSSKAVLAYLEHNVSSGAILHVDDDSNWQGFRMAVDEAEWLKPFRPKLVDGTLVIDTGLAV